MSQEPQQSQWVTSLSASALPPFNATRARFHIEALRGRRLEEPPSPRNLLEALQQAGLTREQPAQLLAPESPPAPPAPRRPSPTLEAHAPRRVNGAQPERPAKKERGPLITVRRSPCAPRRTTMARRPRAYVQSGATVFQADFGRDSTRRAVMNVVA
jgi:hypothetical protein